jgi:hypothetical protein
VLWAAAESTTIRSTLPKGQCRLVDGTRILLSGVQDVAGDLIQVTLLVKGHQVQFKAIGVAGVRLADDGGFEAMVAGGLQLFRVGSLDISLKQPVDVALWRDRQSG